MTHFIELKVIYMAMGTEDFVGVVAQDMPNSNEPQTYSNRIELRLKPEVAHKYKVGDYMRVEVSPSE